MPSIAAKSQITLSLPAVHRPSPKFTIGTAGESGQLFPCRSLRVAVIGGGPAGALTGGDPRSRLSAGLPCERYPAGSTPCGCGIPLYMLDEFSLPPGLVDDRATRMKIISPSNPVVDFGSKTLEPDKYIAILRPKVLRLLPQLITGVVTCLNIPAGTHHHPYTVQYLKGRL